MHCRRGALPGVDGSRLDAVPAAGQQQSQHCRRRCDAELEGGSRRIQRPLLSLSSSSRCPMVCLCARSPARHSPQHIEHPIVEERHGCRWLIDGRSGRAESGQRGRTGRTEHNREEANRQGRAQHRCTLSTRTHCTGHATHSLHPSASSPRWLSVHRSDTSTAESEQQKEKKKSDEQTRPSQLGEEGYRSNERTWRHDDKTVE